MRNFERKGGVGGHPSKSAWLRGRDNKKQVSYKQKGTENVRACLSHKSRKEVMGGAYESKEMEFGLVKSVLSHGGNEVPNNRDEKADISPWNHGSH